MTTEVPNYIQRLLQWETDPELPRPFDLHHPIIRLLRERAPDDAEAGTLVLIELLQDLTTALSIAQHCAVGRIFQRGVAHAVTDTDHAAREQVLQAARRLLDRLPPVPAQLMPTEVPIVEARNQLAEAVRACDPAPAKG